ncbi:MAG: LamG domain-containing protein, partial [Spirochaetia bacterium]|nr:LamG domain-containing protein [Spirochaetia bacterium]
YIRFNGDSSEIRFDGSDENTVYDLGFASNSWLDGLDTEIPAGILDENGAFRTKITYPSQCENGVQDENELGIDCGGPCGVCSEDTEPTDPITNGGCGNGIIDGDEWCDYSASTVSNLRCSDFGYEGSDKVKCDINCVVDLSYCPGYNPSANETCEFLTKTTREQEIGEFKPSLSSGGETSDAVGLIATAGDYMYAKSYGDYDGADNNLAKIRKSDGVVVENVNTLSSSISMFYYPAHTDYLGFHEEGVIYNGYISSGKIQILDLKINQKYWSSTPSSFIMKPDDSNVAASSGYVLLTTDGKYIYNLSYKISSLYDGFKVKIYDPKNNMKMINSWSTSYPSFDVGGIVADGGYLYAIEKGNNARIIRMNAETGAYIYSWRTENDFGYAEFDGVDDYMIIPTTSDFNFGNGGVSYSAWIKTLSSETDYIVHHDYTNDIYYYIVGGRARALIRDQYGNYRYRTSASKINDNRWHNFTFTWNGLTDELNLYVDGIKDQSETVINGGSVGPIELTNTVFIGGASSYSYKGSLSELRIYNRVLSDSEIRSITYSDDVDSILSLQNGLIAYYPFQTQTVRAIESSNSDNLIPNGNINSYPTVGNSWGTYNTNQYNSAIYFNIGNISSVENNIVTLSSIEHPMYTYDVLRPESSGGGVVAGRDYLIKKHSANTFSLHEYNSSQDGSLGFA